MIGIEILFRSGRYHANGWYHAHNEGVPEWPPSPWRILRALLSSAYSLNIPIEIVAPVLEKLRGLPRYQLPLAVVSHIRHYVPDTDHARHNKSKLFDSFVAVEGGAVAPAPLFVGWEVELTRGERELLEQLVAGITYLGRAESWADIKVIDGLGIDWNCRPSESEPASNATILVGCANQASLDEWKNNAVPPSKKELPLPKSLVDVLTFSGERFRAEGWSAVPGTLKARYVVNESPFRKSIKPRRSGKSFERSTVAHYAIRSSVLPRREFGVSISERIRLSLMKISDGRPVFAGHESGSHQHAFYLPIADSNGFISSVVVAVRDSSQLKFDASDVRALQHLRRIWGHGGHDLELVLVNVGTTTTVKHPVTQQARIWVSHTPFVPTRHPKTRSGREVDGIADQLSRACEQLVGQRPQLVEPFGNRLEWAKYRRNRQTGGGRKGPDFACGARLTFAEPVRGPLAIGYGAHFGLGLFLPAEES